MATLKITDRDEVLRRVLTEVFTPRFAEVKKLLQLELRAHLAAEHQVFNKLIADSKSRPYLAITRVKEFYCNDSRMRTPKYGKCYRMPDSNSYYTDREIHEDITDADTPTPATMYAFKLTKPMAEYQTAWTDYLEGRKTLSALLNSYTTREKLTADFPEYAKYLPPIEVREKLPMVIVGDVRAKLTSLGIPS
jgi:hypothetical protein